MKKRVTFEVDGTALFDAIRDMNGDLTMIGARVVMSMLSDPDTSTQIGLAYYGVEYVGAEPVTGACNRSDSVEDQGV